MRNYLRRRQSRARKTNIRRKHRHKKSLCLDESARVLAVEVEGAAARLEWDQMP